MAATAAEIYKDFSGNCDFYNWMEGQTTLLTNNSISSLAMCPLTSAVSSLQPFIGGGLSHKDT